MLLRDLTQFLDKKVRLHMTDGEVALVKVTFVDEEYGDIIVDVIETSRPERYENRSAAYTFGVSDIESAELFG